MKSSTLMWLLLGLTLSSARQVLRIQPLVDAQSYYGNGNGQISAVDEEEDSNLKDVPEYALANRPSTHQLRAVSRTSNSKNVLSNLSSSKIQPVQTIRNYNKVNDDGSFTFGYEAADGSFKEETRGTDCVVRGKYGYIDPDGNKREFTYVSGNPCDPNGEVEDDDELLAKKQENDNEEFEGPANYPSVRPLSSAKPNYPKKPAVTTQSSLLHREAPQLYTSDNEEYKINDEPAPAILIKPNYRTKTRPNYYSVAPVQAESLYSTTPYPKAPSSTQNTVPTTIHRSTTSPPKYNNHASPSSIRYIQQYTTPSYSKLESATTRSPQLESTAATIAITPRPHTLQVATEYLSPASNSGNHRNPSNNDKPKVVYSKPHPSASPVLSAAPLNENVQLSYASELEDYVNTDSVIKNLLSSTSPKPLNVKSAKPVYQSQLVYNPSSGQYKTQLYQTLPQSLGDYQIKHKLQPLVAQQIINQPASQAELHQLQASLSGRPPAPSRQSQPQEKIYQQQQTEQLLQSQQLFAQQQRRQQHKIQTAAVPKYQFLPAQKDPQAAYYYAVTPSSVPSPSSSISLEQIDQFLRGRTSTF